ncbi:unnamed protein product [Ectocarpus sp. 12 AP-2014]
MRVLCPAACELTPTTGADKKDKAKANTSDHRCVKCDAPHAAVRVGLESNGKDVTTHHVTNWQCCGPQPTKAPVPQGRDWWLTTAVPIDRGHGCRINEEQSACASAGKTKTVRAYAVKPSLRGSTKTCLK